MPFRGGCGHSAEIPAGWARNLHLLPDRLSEARSTGSGESSISVTSHEQHRGNIMPSCIHRAAVTGRALRVMAFLSLAFSFAMPAARAAELQVTVSIALRGAVAEMAAAFEKQSGHTIRMTVAAPGEIVAALK